MLIAAFALAVAPRFDAFISRAAGSFTGASFSWALSQQDDTFAPLGVAAGFVSPLSPCATESTEIMRSCGGAVQGLTETQGPSEIALNRAHDGFVYFDDGSWALAPTLLDAESPTRARRPGLAASPRGAGRALLAHGPRCGAATPTSRSRRCWAASRRPSPRRCWAGGCRSS